MIRRWMNRLRIPGPLLKTLDRYIIRKFLGTFFFAITLLILLVIVFDISEKIDDFIKHEAPLGGIIFTYYINFLPYFVNLFMYLFTFIAVIFFTSKLAGNTEIVAMLSSGVSFRRLLRPYMIAASILTILSLLLTNFIIPYTNYGMLSFERRYIMNKKYVNDINIHKQIEPGTFAYVESYNIDKSEGFKFSLEKFDTSGLVFKIRAQRIFWDENSGKWFIENYESRRIRGMEETIRRGTIMDTVIPLKPQDFTVDIEDEKIMSYGHLRQFIKEKKLKGDADVVAYEVKKYSRVAQPFATIILTLIGVSLSSRKKRGGIGINLGIGILLTFMYIFFMQISNVFATFGNLTPLLAVWIPNIVFGIIAIFLLRIAPK